MFNDINWSEVFSSQFWFGVDRLGLHLTDRIILVGGATLVLVGIIILIVRFISNNHLLKPYYAKLTSVFLTIGLLEMLWFLLRTQYVNALGTRFTAAGIILVGLLWLIQPIRYLMTQYKTDYELHQKQLQKEKVS